MVQAYTQCSTQVKKVKQNNGVAKEVTHCIYEK